LGASPTPTLSVVAVLLLYYVVVVFLLTYYAVAVQLKTGGTAGDSIPDSWCVDSTGASKSYTWTVGQTIANSNILVSRLNITGNDTYFLYIAAEKIILSNGDSIQAQVSANTVTSTVSYTSI
jgi:hypothetical protein